MTEFERFLDRVMADREVLGLVLSGSHAREGTATSHSDHDLYAVVTPGAALAPRRDALLDVVVMTLDEFRAHALPGSGTEWNRYAFAYSQVLKDTPDGLIASLAAAKGTLAAEEAGVVAYEALGAFLNSAYRCLKNARDGADALLPLLAAALTLEAGGAVRTLLNDLEPHARAAGHGEIYDSWGADLAFLRGR